MTNRDYMPAEVFPPGEFLKEELEARGWTQADFANILGRPRKTINEIVLGKRAITPDMARAIAEGLGTSARIWLNLETEYQLYKAERQKPAVRDIAQRAVLYRQYPVREMINRGWIQETESVDVLEHQFRNFFAHNGRGYAARKTEDERKLPLQVAWLNRVYNIAEDMQVEKFSEIGLARALAEIKGLLISTDAIVKIPEILSAVGIRFIIVEFLPKSKIDGVCFWIDDESPVIALSLRFDRIDYFWFTLMHELYHVKYKHGRTTAILDTRMEEPSDAISSEEQLADAGAEDFLVSQSELKDFIAKAEPFFTPARIEGFARRIAVHPGIVVGQLQNRGLLDYKQHRKTLVPIRSLITSTATFDGWGMVA